MAKIYPTDWKTQVRIFELYGCQYKRKKGSHHVLTYPGAKRVVVIPEYDEIDVDIIKKLFWNRRPTFGNEILVYGFLIASLTFSMLFSSLTEIKNSHKRRLA